MSDLRIYAEGEAFRDGRYDLRALETVISNYRAILDRLISIQIGQRQVTRQIKRQIDYEVRLNPGSIELLLEIVLQNKELLVASSIASDGGYQLAKAIVDLFGDAIALRKAASDFLKKGIQFNIKINNSFNFGGNNVNTVENDSQIIVSDARILFGAQATRVPVNNILRSLDGKEVQYVDFSTKDRSVQIDESARELLGSGRELLSSKLQIVGRLDMVSFSSHRGAIVSDGDRFPVTWDEAIRNKMQKVADVEGVIFTVHPLIDRARLDTQAISFHVVDCDDPQGFLD